MFRVFLVLILFYSSIFAYDSNSTNENNYIDKAHSSISHRVKYISLGIDDFILDKLDFFSNRDKNTSVIKPNKVDELFINEKFINETRKSYIKLSTDFLYNSIDENSANVNLSASVALNKSNRRLKLFLNNFNQDNINDITKKSDYTQNKPEFGLSIIHDISKNIESKYSLGIRSLYPFARATFTYEKKIGNWRIEPFQNFEYSIKDEFKEYTILYLDKEVLRKVLFRAEFGRGTSSKTSGMDYDSVFHLFWTPQAKTGLQLSQGFYGNTRYEYTADANTGITERFDGINNYVTQLTFRQNIFRKWFFYQLSPGVNFSKSHDFKANYSFFARFDIIFGEI